MKNEVLKEKIKLFWEWFVVNEALMRDVVKDELHDGRAELVNAIDNQVLNFGMFTWEIAEEKNASFSFTISPNGNIELLQISKGIMKNAPILSHWQFNYAKPAKDWNFQFNVFDDYANEHCIDASAWKFILLPYPHNKTKLIIEAKNIIHLDDNTKDSAGDYVLTHTLGEEYKINNIAAIEIVNEFESQFQDSYVSIIDLQKRFIATID